MVALFGFSAAIGWTAIGFHDPSVPEHQITDRPIQVEDDGYVSSQSCKTCHPSQYETWHASYHRTMTQVATPETVRADFNGVRVTGVQGRPMVLERRGNEFWAEFDDPDWKDKGQDQPTPIKRQVVMVTGSHHQQVYWYQTGNNRLLGQVPGVYVLAEREWIPRNAAFLRPPAEPSFSESGRWNRVCIECHATHGKPRFDPPFRSQPLETLFADTTVAEFGIACEACHGPGGQHARSNRSPARRYGLHLTGRADPTTVRPTRVNPRLSSDICGQCHAVTLFHDEAGGREANASGFPYRPGDELAKTRFVVQPTKNLGSPTIQRILAGDPAFVTDAFWSDGMVRVSGREYNGLIESPCFKDAREEERTMTCFSCHTMHKTPADTRSIGEWARTHQVSTGMSGNDACVQCHKAFRANLQEHTKHEMESTGSLCYNCHMPYTSYGLLKALRSHQVSSPTVAASLQTGRPNACNLCHLDKTLGWTSEYLGNWYGTPKVRLNEDEQSVAASVLWLLRGDAGQRALAAWSLGWLPAQQASGTSWMPPYLSLLLNDSYPAVRFISRRSLRSLPGFAGFEYDLAAPPAQRTADSMRVIDIWRRARPRPDDRNAAVPPYEVDGAPSADVVRLLRQRDNRRVSLTE
jgi:hypothetical protein